MSDTKELNDLVAAAAQVRRRFEGDAYLNLAFYAGQQWLRWDTNRLFEVKLDDGSFEQTTDNRIRPLVRTEIARMTKTRPRFIGVPKSSSDADIAGARFASQALDDAWQRFNLRRKLRQALLWSRTTPAGYWKIWWDPTIGKRTNVLVYGEDHERAGTLIRDGYQRPLRDPAQLPEGTPYRETSVAEGEICAELRSFFQVFVDPHCSEAGLEDAEYIGEENVYSRKWMRQHFPEFADAVRYDKDPTPGVMESRLPFASLATTTTEAGKGVKVRELWSRTEHYVWWEDTLLLQEPNPYPWIPYVAFRAPPVPGRFYGDPVVNDLRPVQIDLNLRQSQIAENAGRIGNPPLLVPSSMYEDFDWQGLPGEKIPYQDTGSPTAMPSFMQVPSPPPYIENDIQRKQNSLQEISGQHEVTGAQVPAGVTAAAAISQLQEADDTRIGPDIAEMENAIEEAGRMILDLMRRYYSDGRAIAISGEGGMWDFYAWKKGMLDGVEDVRVEAGSSMPESKAAKQAAIQQFATLFSQNNPGAITPRGWARILQDAGVGGLDAFFAQLNRDQQQVTDENRRLMTGEPLVINSYDNDGAHVEFHEDFQKSPAYREAPDGLKQNFEAHVEQHRMRQAQKALAQQMPPGMPPMQAPPGTGSPPVGVEPSAPPPNQG